ncbi:DNA gyrase inhibitor YacG [Pirellulales bacterium]|nr:DNA gyrase inhibitor YacG [Pirellulales bacterium]
MPQCPVCNVQVFLKSDSGNPSMPTAPFCSERCKIIDLGRWLDERYNVPHIARNDDDGDEEIYPDC